VIPIPEASIPDSDIVTPPPTLTVLIVVMPDTIIFPSTLILAATPGDAPISIPDRAVTKPTESIFVTSSYVRVPPIVTLPL